ncbi:NAD(P)-dependent alcohol dehydrogenase [Chloroflexota bacterium]
MRAIIWTEYGPPEVLQLMEVEKPVPEDDEVLIRIRAATVTAGDCEQRGLKLQIWYRLIMRLYVGLRKPERIVILGTELAGEIESIGKDVKRFKVGDQVFAATGFTRTGAYAEYLCLPEEPEEGALALKPANITFEEAAPVPVGGLEALYLIRKGNIQDGQKVLINGAAGTIGTFAVQLAGYYGAEVTAVDSTHKLDMLRSIGAEHVIDYTKEDFTDNDQTYDVIIDVAGKGAFSRCLRSLTGNGKYLIANPRLSQMVRGRLTSMISMKKVMFGSGSPKTEDLLFLKSLIEAEKIISIIDRCYPLEQAAEAHWYVETGQKTGNVILTL